ncbi:S41 family peptidase [Mucilaginibacter sp. SP1R1]|uniref:S41 family peptidase n=1 Tax=Mucilaginibacter sp. SP1R1 TaxID=2723091 RepID=UPI003B006BB4
MKKILYPILIFSLGMITACKKDKGPTNNGNTGGKTDTTAAVKLKLTQDSIYLYAQEIYYWNSFLPVFNIFNPEQYTNGSTDLAKFTTEIDAYTQLSKNSANHNLPYEYDPFNPGSSKYSFIDDGTVNGELNATKGDFGFNYFYNTYTDLRISLVYPNSPAAAAGLKRGDKITSINGSTDIYIVTNPNDPSNDPAYKYVSNALNSGSTVTLKVTNASGSKTVTLNTKTYTVNPVIYVNTYPLTGGKVAGYMVFNSFVSLNNIQARLDSVFSVFASKNVTDLIIDLRYNGGGDVETSSYLSNLIAPSGASGTVMNTTYWTANLQNDTYPLLKKKISEPAGWFKPANQVEKFTKAGAVNVNRVFFLVTNNTASASELTINNLRPKMNVQLVGDTTYGKPVGFLSQLTIQGHYLYTPEFETKNSSGQGGIIQVCLRAEALLQEVLLRVNRITKI